MNNPLINPGLGTFFWMLVSFGVLVFILGKWGWPMLLKALKKRYPRADFTARNLPLGSAELQKRLGVASGGDVHIFGCRLADGSSVLLVTAGE